MMFLLLLAILVGDVSSLNILVYSPALANSHMNFMGHLADTLTDAGHNVTLLVPVVDERKRDKLGVKTTKDIIYVERDEIAQKKIKQADEVASGYWLEVFKPEDLIEGMTWYIDMMTETCANILRNPTLFEKLKSKNFDVFMIEPLFVCGMGLAHALGIKKMILTTSCTQFDYVLPYIGEPEELSYVPTLLSKATDQMSITERYDNLKASWYSRKSVEPLFDNEEKLYKAKFGEEVPSWRELFPSASLYFTNSNPNIDFPRPTIQKTVPIGGITLNMEYLRSQKLPEEWDSILNLRSKTMLISFGSFVLSKDMPIEWRDNLLKVIDSFPDVTFIWKYESNDTQWAENVKNIHFSHWVPQTALLNDKRVTAFLTHGGLGSTNELAHLGKPALMIPIYCDQVRNAQMLSRHRGVIMVDKQDLGDFDVLRKAVDTILQDESYKQNAERLAEILENQPVSPRDLVVKYTEFVGKFGPFPQMDPYVRHLNFIQRHSLDILTFFHYGYYIAGFFVLIIIKVIVSALLRKKEKSD